MQIHVKPNKVWVGVLAAALLTACSDDNDNNANNPVEEASFRVTVTNLSAAQPISPVGVVLHDGSHQFWTVGGAASDALEQLAEGGNNQPWLDNAIAEGAVTSSGAGAIGPGGFETIEISGDSRLGYLTVAGMLVNTNDAFAGLQQWDVGALVTGDTLSQVAMVYDAGTEDNSEQASTFPGPASGGGEGFNSTRDDLLDAVRIHAGVISADDGLLNSALNASHRFDNPGIRIQVERL